MDCKNCRFGLTSEGDSLTQIKMNSGMVINMFSKGKDNTVCVNLSPVIMEDHNGEMSCSGYVPKDSVKKLE